MNRININVEDKPFIIIAFNEKIQPDYQFSIGGMDENSEGVKQFRNFNKLISTAIEMVYNK